jgi:hypothetical protein
MFVKHLVGAGLASASLSDSVGDKYRTHDSKRFLQDHSFDPPDIGSNMMSLQMSEGGSAVADDTVDAVHTLR